MKKNFKLFHNSSNSKLNEENENIEKIYQAQINDLDQIYKDKQVRFERSHSFRASLTPNKTNIVISDKEDIIFFK